MATLIQSKQIEGIVTASVIHGEFTVSGSLVVTGSQSVLGAVTASSISSSFSGDFTGDGSGLTGITYSQIGNTPQFVGGNNITITSSSNVITVHAQLDGTGSDAQSLSISGDQLTILGGNTITIPTGSNISDYTELTNIPSGIISGSSQITITQSQISDLSHTDISSLNTFSASIQSEVDSLTAATSSYLTEVPAGTISGSEQLPAGLISGSSQITITQSQISDLSHYSDSDVKTKLDTEGVLSGSLVSQLPSGLISGSTFTDYSSSIQTELADVRTDLITQFTNNDNALQSQVTDLQTFTSSIQSEVDSLTSATSSYLTTVPSGTISGSQQIIDSLPSGVISGSSQISISESQITDLTHYTNSDVQSYLDSIGVVSGSVIAELPSGVISGSSQITISSSQISDLTHTQIPSGTISGSEQLPQGLVSGSTQVIDSLPSGVISGSSQITITESQISDLSHTDISNLNTFTSSIQSEVDSLTAATSSYLTSIDSGIVSSSAQVTDLLPSGVVSGSSQITITESQISDLTHYTDSDVKTKLDSEGVLSGSLVSQLPSGVISGSDQVSSSFEQVGRGIVSGSDQVSSSFEQVGSGIVSSSVQVIEHLPQGTVSGSTQVISHLPTGTVSGSVQTIDNLPSGVVSGSFSSSMATAVELLNEVSGANYLESKSVDSRLDTIEGSIGMYYDLSNTVWNNKYIKSGSNQASDTAEFQTGNVPFKFRLNTDRKLHYQEGDVVYISNFDRDTTITATVSSSYETGSREIGFNVVSINQSDTVTRINDSYWVLSRHTAGFVDSASYVEASSSFDYRIGVIVASGSGADWNVNLTNIPQGIISASQQLYSESVDVGLATTASLNSISTSLDTKIENVFLSSSNFDNKTLVSGSSQIDLRNVTNYVADEHIDHTTINITAGDGLDGGGDISSTREIRLNVTSSHFTSGVSDVLTSEGVVKQSTLDADIVGTDFSQSVDNRINSISAGLTPAGTVSGSSQIDITQTQNYTSFSSSIATSIAGASGASSWGELSGIPRGLVSSSEQVLGGTGILSGSHTDISSLNDYTSSTDSRLSNLESFTSSLDVTYATDSELTSLSSSVATTIDNIQHTQIPSGTVSGSSQVAELLPSGIFSGSFIGQGNVTITSGSGYVIISGSGGSGGSSDVSYDGNRVISNENLGDLFTNSVNPGTSGSIQDFLNAVFYPNTAPSISTGNQTIEEYRTNGSTIVTLSGTDPEGQSITWGTGSSYTDDLVRVSSVGVMTLNALPTSASFNTSAVGGGHGHLVKVTATDSFGTSTEKDIYIIVTPNAAPIFRETSVSGNQITSVTSNLNENSTNGTLVKRVYFTDAESDAITIYSSSVDNNHFAITKYSTYVDITQNTSSLDYEQQTQYTFTISVADEHYVSGDDLDSITTLPITVNVTDNLTPTLSDQTLSDINENSSNGASVGSISAVDNEGDTITFKNFQLHQLQLDGSVVSSGSYGGSSQLTDPTENPFQMNSSGVVTRKTGVYLNSDLINKYIYRVQVTDNFNGDSNVALVTINITDDTPATVGKNWSTVPNPTVIESATNGSRLYTNSTGFGNIQYADFNSNQSGTWSSSKPAVTIDSNGSIYLGVDLSGSVTQSGDTLDSVITFTNTFGTTTNYSLTVDVKPNSAPTATFTNQSSVFNTNQATNGTNLVSVSISDTESDSPYQLSIGGVNASSFTAVPQNSTSSSWQIQANGDLSAGSYSYDVTVTDSYSKSTSYSRSLTIAQADNGTLGGDTTSYIIESAESGDSLRDASGYNAGNTSQLSVSYSTPTYGSPVVQSYTSSNPAIVVDGSGNLTLGVNISGSATGSGDTISSTITFQDQYGNVGSGLVTVNVFANAAPTATFTNNSSIFNSNQATSGTNLVDVSITDTEGDTPYGLTLGGEDSGLLSAVPQNANSSSWEIQPSSDLSGGTYTYDVTVTDNFGKSTTYSNRTLTITAADTGTMATNGTFYVIESATSGNNIVTTSNGKTGTQGGVVVSYSPNYGSQSATSFSSNNPLIAVNSTTGKLTVGTDISGSGNTNGSIIGATISWTDQYENIGSDTIAVNVAKNNAPTVLSTQTFNENTNQATGSSEIVRLNLTDTEGDSILSSGLSWTNYNSTYFTPSNSTGVMKLLVNSTSIPAGTYPYTASIEDVHGFETRLHSGSVTISQASTGTLGGDTSIYIIESAQSGDVFRDATGYNQGNAAQLSVSYSPNYGSQTVTQYISSTNPAISVDSSGNLTLGVDISGSVTQSGDTFTSTITFTDQYGNVGSGSVTATVFGNSTPSANFTAASFNTDEAISGSNIGNVTVTDTENNSPFTITLGGTDGGKFDVQGSSSPFTIQPTGSLEAGSYSINITVTDTYGESITLTNESITVSAAEVLTTVYIYTSTRGATGITSANYNGILGITSEDTSKDPDLVTGIQTLGSAPLYMFKTGNLGSSSITVGGGTMTLRAERSGSNLDSIVSSSFDGSNGSEQFMILWPSGSTLAGGPTSVTDSGGSTAGEYIVYVKTAGESSYNAVATQVHQFDIDSAVDGYTRWNIIGREGLHATTAYDVRIIPSSGSAPS